MEGFALGYAVERGWENCTTFSRKSPAWLRIVLVVVGNLGNSKGTITTIFEKWASTELIEPAWKKKAERFVQLPASSEAFDLLVPELGHLERVFGSLKGRCGEAHPTTLPNLRPNAPPQLPPHRSHQSESGI